MPDTMNLLDADAMAIANWVTAFLRKSQATPAYTALRDEIVRQAREGMVDGQLHFSRVMEVAKERDEAEAENARLRAELETAKRDALYEATGAVVMGRNNGKAPEDTLLDYIRREYPAPAVADTGERSPKPMSEEGANLWVEVQDGVCVITHAIARRIVAMGGGK